MASPQAWGCLRTWSLDSQASASPRPTRAALARPVSFFLMMPRLSMAVFLSPTTEITVSWFGIACLRPAVPQQTWCWDSPVSVGTDGVRLLVSDAGNNRVLIYNNLPLASSVTADLELGQPGFGSSA